MEETKIGKYKILYSNSKEFHILKREIWGEDIYFFDSNISNPYIIDIGSHIGISALYFKSIYPNSKIVCFEPNPNSFKILEENIYLNDLKDISLHNIAIWKHKGRKNLYIDSEDTGWDSNSSFIENGWTGKEKTKTVSVNTDLLKIYVDREIDMLKVDTEGSEISILKSNLEILHRVKNIAIEYHPSKENKLKELLSILNRYFLIEIYSEGKLLKKPIEGILLTVKGKKLVK